MTKKRLLPMLPLLLFMHMSMPYHVQAQKKATQRPKKKSIKFIDILPTGISMLTAVGMIFYMKNFYNRYGKKIDSLQRKNRLFKLKGKGQRKTNKRIKGHVQKLNEEARGLEENNNEILDMFQGLFEEQSSSDPKNKIWHVDMLNSNKEAMRSHNKYEVKLCTNAFPNTATSHYSYELLQGANGSHSSKKGPTRLFFAQDYLGVTYYLEVQMNTIKDNEPTLHFYAPKIMSLKPAYSWSDNDKGICQEYDTKWGRENENKKTLHQEIAEAETLARLLHIFNTKRTMWEKDNKPTTNDGTLEDHPGTIIIRAATLSNYCQAKKISINEYYYRFKLRTSLQTGHDPQLLTIPKNDIQSSDSWWPYWRRESILVGNSTPYQQLAISKENGVPTIFPRSVGEEYNLKNNIETLQAYWCYMFIPDNFLPKEEDDNKEDK